MRSIEHKYKGALDTHFYFLFVCIALLVALLVFLTTSSGGGYYVQKYQYMADQAAKGKDIASMPESEFSTLLEMYRKAIAMNPTHERSSKIQFQIVGFYRLRNEPAKAIEELQNILLNFGRKNHISGEARFAIGKIYEEQGDWENALKTYNETIENNVFSQKGLLAPLYIAEHYKKSKQADKAKAAYEFAINHYQYKLDEIGDISQAAILNNFLALTYASQGQWKRAVEQWHLILEKYPASKLVPATLLALGEAYSVQMKERSKAVEFYTRLIQGFPKTELAFEAKVRLVQLYYYSKEFKGARYWARELLQDKTLDPDLRAEVRLIEGRTFQMEGSWEKAEKIYDSVLVESPKSLAAMRVPIIKAKYYEAEENPEEANRLYGEALLDYQRLTSEEEDSKVAINAQDLISMTYATKKDWPALIAHLDQLIGETKDEARRPQLLFLRADIVANKLGEKERAKILYEEFLNTYPMHPLCEMVGQELEKITGLNPVVPKNIEKPDVVNQNLPEVYELDASPVLPD